MAPQSTVRAAAQYDASAALIVLKDWDGAIRTLEDFRTRFPNHALQGEVSGKLAVAYLEKGQWASAAGEFERLADDQPRSEDQPRRALAGRRAVREGRIAAERDQGLRALPGASTRSRSSPRSRRAGACPGSPRPTATPAREAALMRDIFHADQNGGSARTDRTRYLGATAALAMAEPVAAEYRKVALVEPLQRQLQLKKTKMEEALEGLCGGRRLRRRRRDDRGHLPHRHRLSATWARR